MQFVIEAPSSLETAQLIVTSNTLQLVPRVLRGATHVRVAYLSAKGENGAEVRAILVFNPNRREFMLQRVNDDPVALEFDMLPASTTRKRKPKPPDTVQNEEGEEDDNDKTEGVL